MEKGERKMNLLIVDDNVPVVNGIEKIIDRQEFSIDFIFKAFSMNKAMEILEREKIDLLISDIEMPQMDGHRLTKLVKSDKEFQHIPLVIFSSLITEEMRRKGKELGADEQMSKPEIGHLVQVIDHLLEHTKS